MNILNGSAILLGGMLILTGLGGFGFLSSNLFLSLIIWFFIGIFIASISVCYSYLLQTPARLMGRVTSTANTMVHGAMVISPTLGSLLALWIKVSGFFLLAGVLITRIGMIIYLAHTLFMKKSSRVTLEHN
ncbi:hypothetical protein [Bacillus mycoides]|uniref:hypothetical protein n=1 Tax=Bacillus mycoides TaxID=1405 RepID=UPI003D64C38D